MKKLRVAVIHPDPVAKWSFPLVWDGLRAAMDIIGQKYEVKWFVGEDEPYDSYDWILPWGTGSLPFNNTIEKYKCKKALLCAGHPFDTANMEKFEAVFVESPEVYRQLKPFCKRIEIAFGTDTNFFKPNINESKIFDVVYVATWSGGWKRQSLLAESVKGLRVCVAGSLQPDGVEGLEKCMENAVYTLVGLLPTRLVPLLYQMSGVCVITACHGSERSMLEALSCNIPLVLTKDNKLGVSLVEDQAIIVDPNPIAIRAGIERALRMDDINTRDWVLKNYSAEKYANKILEVIEG